MHSVGHDHFYVIAFFCVIMTHVVHGMKEIFRIVKFRRNTWLFPRTSRTFQSLHLFVGGLSLRTTEEATQHRRNLDQALRGGDGQNCPGQDGSEEAGTSTAVE